MDNLTGLITFRKSLEPFVVFSEAEWLLFAAHVTFSTLKKKLYYTVPGKVCDKISFILTGSMRYFYVKDGEDITSYFSFENDLASSYKSYITGMPGLVYIQAMEDTQLINISRADMDEMFAHPLLAYKMEQFGRQVAEYTICCFDDRVSAFLTQTPEERYLNLLNTGHEILQRIPQHYIAHFLGITPVSLSRIRRRTMAVK